MNLEQKTSKTIESFQQTTRSGGGCGCVGIGCGVVTVLFLTMCIGGYFLGMHSSVPLSMIESALESEGEVQVEGLKGSISSGFEIESLKFESDEGDEWNELRQVRFSYNGFLSVMLTKRLVIDEASIGGATIYTRIDGDGQISIGDQLDGEEFANELAEWQDFQDEDKLDESNQLKEFRIDKLSARDILIIDPSTGTKLEFNKIEFRDYQMLDGEVSQIGDLVVVSDQLDLETKESTLFADEAVAWNLTGNVKPIVHQSIVSEIPFDVDFAIRGANEFRLHLSLFDGLVEIDEPYSPHSKIKLKNFSPAEYFDMGTPLGPTQWNVNLQVVRSQIEVEEPIVNRSPQQTDQADDTDLVESNGASDDDLEGAASTSEKDSEADDDQPKTMLVKKNVHTLKIEPNGTFMLGTTRFDISAGEVVFGPGSRVDENFVTATGDVDGQTVTARITIQDQAPWGGVELSAAGKDARDLWANLFFDKPYVALDAGDQRMVDAVADRSSNSNPALDQIEPAEQ